MKAVHGDVSGNLREFGQGSLKDFFGKSVHSRAGNEPLAARHASDEPLAARHASNVHLPEDEDNYERQLAVVEGGDANVSHEEQTDGQIRESDNGSVDKLDETR